MKELKHVGNRPIIETHYPLKHRKLTKRWVIAMNSSAHRQKKGFNNSVEAACMRIVGAVKKLYLQQGTIYFEQDSRTDRASTMAMHTLLTPDFYIHLQCNFLYDYEVEYAFYDCTYEGRVRGMLAAYPLDKAAKPFDMLPSFTEFYNSVVTIANTAHIHTL